MVANGVRNRYERSPHSTTSMHPHAQPVAAAPMPNSHHDQSRRHQEYHQFQQQYPMQPNAIQNYAYHYYPRFYPHGPTMPPQYQMPPWPPGQQFTGYQTVPYVPGPRSPAMVNSQPYVTHPQPNARPMLYPQTSNSHIPYHYPQPYMPSVALQHATSPPKRTASPLPPTAISARRSSSIASVQPLLRIPFYPQVCCYSRLDFSILTHNIAPMVFRFRHQRQLSCSVTTEEKERQSTQCQRFGFASFQSRTVGRRRDYQ